MVKIRIGLSRYENSRINTAKDRRAVMEFHIRRPVREEYGLDGPLFSLRGNVVLTDLRQVRELAARFNAKTGSQAGQPVRAGELYAMGLIDEILHYMVALYREQVQPDAFETALARLETNLDPRQTAALLQGFNAGFPPRQVYAGEQTVAEYLAGADGGESCRTLSLEEILLLALANLNPGFKPFRFLFDDRFLAKETVYPQAVAELQAHLKELPTFGPEGQNLWTLLRAPALASPDSVAGQLEYMRKHWGLLIGKFLGRLLIGLDVIKEEEKPGWAGGPPGPMDAYTYRGLDEYERFSPDQDWMPRTVLMAKSTLVWLYQLSQKYGRPIEHLDHIPDEELDELACRGFTGLWLIGLWERSNASRTIKQWKGNPEAAASAYSLYDYDIAGELGGWGALGNLRERCQRRGIRLGSDMVPNHTGLDSRWIMEHPDRFLQLDWPPYPQYQYNSDNLSSNPDIVIQIEDHYYNNTDCAVVFHHYDRRSNRPRYIYHGNDGTSMPWNDTAQIDFLNPEAREAVIQTIIGVCKQFPIVRFDAAMTLAKRHIQRLWYPAPGQGGDIASRAEHAISDEEFNRRIPNEFWREVVDRCAVEAPNTLLLAEAFWMMEGYFVRTLGMHRVYNSAFMNMLKMEDNAKYRTTIKNTLEFEPEILKRFVNFMNNPDEETAVVQFGKGDKYFGIATLLVTMPGLPMFGHGQIEGFEEKYGMEYRRAYQDEKPDQWLVDRHEREIFPLMKKRYIFSGSANFVLYDFFANGTVNENVFAYSNRATASSSFGDERALVLYNNAYSEAAGLIHRSAVEIPQKDGSKRRNSLTQALGLHGTDPWFVLLREQRSNLWYIRSSKDMAERGFFAALPSYGTQVFLDIHELEDGADGKTPHKWAKLNHELDGRGVPDMNAALQDLFLGELYWTFAELVKVLADDNAVQADVETKAEAFIVCALKFLGGDGWEPFVSAGSKAVDDSTAASDSKIDSGSKNIKTKKSTVEDTDTSGSALRKPDADRIKLILKEFSAVRQRLATLRGALAKPPAKLPAQTARFLKTFAVETSAQMTLDACMAGYTALSLLRPVLGADAADSGAVHSGPSAAALALHWSLDRKLREYLAGAGMGADEAWKTVDIMQAVFARNGPNAAKLYGQETAGAIILENYGNEDFRRILGVNRFGDFTWFNKEAFAAALFYGPLFTLLESGLESLEKTAALVEQFRKAEAASEYRLDKFVEALQDSPKSTKRG
ncbi:MAG: alpha-amylase [Treponema sp.]|jgi:glycosidase|nr:alpha-amylase [Treponema sp.]